MNAFKESGAHAVWAYALEESTMPGMRALAVAAPERSRALPHVPTFAEHRLDVVMIRHIGLCMPRGKDKAAEEAAAFFARLMESEKMRGALLAAGYTPASPGTGAAEAAAVKAEQWSKTFLEEYPLREEMR